MGMPTTLIDAVRYFADPANCREYLVSRRWPNGVTCPVCGSTNVYFDTSRNGWECKTRHPKRKFTLKTGTIFEDSPLGFDKWLPVVWMVANCKNGISSHEVARAIGVTQKTAWFMLQRIRLAMQDDPTDKFSGHIEADETFIGGRARFMHKGRKARALKGRESGVAGKIAVAGLLERGTNGESRVRTKIVPNVRRSQLQTEIRRHVRMDGSATVYSDALKSYEPTAKWGPTDLWIHKVIDHAKSYAEGEVHTNGMENYWSLLKRAIKGTYVSVEPFHLFRYLDEQAFRFNNRKWTDADRFSAILKQVIGRRLTYAELIGPLSGTAPA